MKGLCKFIKSTAVVCSLLCALVFSLGFYVHFTVAENYKVYEGESLDFGTKIPVTAVYDNAEFSGLNTTKKTGSSFNVNLKLFGIFPVSSVKVDIVDDMYVAVLGTPFGIRLYTDGVLVVEVSDVDTEKGNVSPAKMAGIEKGDIIITINGKKVLSNEDIAKIIEQSNGQPLTVKFKRNDSFLTTQLTPQKSAEADKYKAGIWVRDSSAGIGTLTFYSPGFQVVAGLGHGVYDSDTGVLMPAVGGQLVGADIFAIEKGKAGSPGELKGRFNSSLIASLEYNCQMGIYGTILGSMRVGDLIPVALKQEIVDGPAKIICTVDGNGPKEYSCEIKRRFKTDNDGIQNMIIKITDDRLLDLTGGIVQGMSGSPILQNGKLIGAITHVLIDDPTKGFGIFAETMLETAQSVGEGSPLPQNSEQLKEAS